ncbi:type I iterative polyketide synthase [Apiospora aurea]|uniref:Type I iterative polyketide synthase n=1 Tax=Apiospora aurea TaxID=335848 RepID=A0ABR1QV73_9PEZI
MAASRDGYVLLFGGQGSATIFSDTASTTAESATRTSSAANILLSRCHAAFLQEIRSLDGPSQSQLGIDLNLFADPHALLKPATQYHTHAVIQASTIYLCQVLHYLAEVERMNARFEGFFDQIQETAGFSSGLIPAAVASRSRTLDEFVTAAVEGFRLAFWMACRTLLFGLELEKKQSAGDDATPEATASLVVRGLSADQVEDRLAQHHATRTADVSLPSSRPLQVSVVTSSNVTSVSGPRADLAAFRSQAVPDLPTTFAHVHGWYHGGEQLEPVVRQVLEDIRSRAIRFSECSGSSKPIRSSLDGTLYDASQAGLPEWIARHLLVHCVNWDITTSGMAASVRKSLDQEPIRAIKLLSFGPGSESLFPELQPFDPRLEHVDLSPFKPRKSTRSHLASPDSIAIVGMSVNLPRGKGLDELWETLSQGLSAVEEIPETRFNVSDYYSEELHKSRSMSAKHGAFIHDPFNFDNAFFNISPREAISMDPQQRVLLHAAQEALEDAGYVPDSTPSFQRATMGCYVGVATGDYTDNLRDNIDVFYSPGTLRAFHAGRISYFYGLSGPSMVTDTACSSSMVSIHQACRALQSGDCTSALAGGVNVISSPDMYLGLDRGHFLSSTGGCKPFDASADGYCRAEGCVLFVLKRLSDAVAEGDRIHGAIRGIEINQSGNAHSITHPHSPTQIDLFQRLLQKTNIDPGSVGAIEAHGTGTQVSSITLLLIMVADAAIVLQAGDAREIESLRAVFGPHHSTRNPLAISSIKGNIGHCEAASGAAGLAKLLLMMRERMIPVQTGFKSINPKFADLESSGFIIPRSTTAWMHSQKTPRRAVLNNFGAAGSNTSLLLEEWVEQLPTARITPGGPERSAYVFAISAKSRAALQETVKKYRHIMDSRTQPSLKDICYTATARRQVYDHRLSLVCSSLEDLRNGLQKPSATTFIPAPKLSVTSFVFSGQGGIYQGMGAELMHTSPVFKGTVTTCEGILRQLGFPSILSMFSDTETDSVPLNAVEAIIPSQCACVVLEYALAKMFMSWGVMPDYVMGHSLGEYAALCISGVLTLETTLRMVATRAKLMVDHCVPDATGMLACNLSLESAESMISEVHETSCLTVACSNSPSDCVIGGPLDQLEAFQKECKARRIKSKLLDVPYAFHSPAMELILEPLRELGRPVQFSKPTIPVLSNVHGRMSEVTDFTSDYFALHARQPVRFSDGLRVLESRVSLEGAVFLEIGPQPTTLPMLRNTFSSSSPTYLSTLHKGQAAWKSLSSALAEMALRKVSVDWRAVYDGSSAKVTNVPGHVLEGSSYLIPYREPAQAASESREQEPADTRRETGFTLLPWLNTEASSHAKSVFETTLAVLGPLITGHDVGGSPICPASVFHELALEGAHAALEPLDGQELVMSNMVFESPLVYSSARDADIVTVHITRVGSAAEANFKVTSQAVQGDQPTAHCTGHIAIKSRSERAHWRRGAALVARQRQYFTGGGNDDVSTFRTKVLYEAIFTRVVKYSAEYQSLAHLKVAGSNLEGIGSFKLPPGSLGSGCIADPVFTDTLLHAAGFIANLAVNSDEVGICARVESVEVAYRDIDYDGFFTVYCSLLDMKGMILADATALNEAGEVVAVVRGMEFKRLRLSAFQHMLSRKSIASPLSRQEDMFSNAKPITHLQKKQQQQQHVVTGLITPPSTGDAPNSPAESVACGTLLAQGISQTLNGIVMEVGGFSERDMDYGKSLDELGIDSLMQIEIVSKLTRAFPSQAGLDHHALSECDTLGALEAKLSSMLQGPAQTTPRLPEPAISGYFPSPNSLKLTPPRPSPNADVRNSLATLHTADGTQVPLCLFHDGSGQSSMYSRLQGHDRSTYAFSDPYFGSSERPHYSIDQMAKSYISQLSRSEHSPIILGGWSFGGVVAFEAARQLMDDGFDVKGLLLIDSPIPIDHEPLPNEVISQVIRGNSALEEEFQFNASLLGDYCPTPLPSTAQACFRTVMLRSGDLFDTETLCGVRYDWLSSQASRGAAVGAWEELVGGPVEVMPIPGNHFEPFSNSNWAS